MYPTGPLVVGLHLYTEDKPAFYVTGKMRREDNFRTADLKCIVVTSSKCLSQDLAKTLHVSRGTGSIGRITTSINMTILSWS